MPKRINQSAVLKAREELREKVRKAFEMNAEECRAELSRLLPGMSFEFKTVTEAQAAIIDMYVDRAFCGILGL